MPEETILIQNMTAWYQGILAVLVLTALLYVISLQKIKTSKIDS